MQSAGNGPSVAVNWENLLVGVLGCLHSCVDMISTAPQNSKNISISDADDGEEEEKQADDKGFWQNSL